MITKTKGISDLISGGGLLIEPASVTKIQDLDFHEVVTLFEKYGVILFRGFDIQSSELTLVTNLYTERYAGEAKRRASRFGQKVVHDVDLYHGPKYLTLHSETSFSPAWPEVIWFYCNIPPKERGETTLCDGIKLWQSLSASTKDFFLSNPICYDLAIPIGEPKPGKGRRDWVSTAPGASGGYIDWETGLLHITQSRYAVHEGRVPGTLCFANHLLCTVKEFDPQILDYHLMDGKKVSDSIIDEIKEKSDALIYNHAWQKGDFIMIDNLRLMHGRQGYGKDDPRDIVIVQTARASFGYGSTTRKCIAKEAHGRTS